MKTLSYSLLATLLISSASASEKSILNKIEVRLMELEKAPKHSAAEPITIPWSALDKKEAGMWATIVDAYDMLKANSRTERYNFMYEAMKAASLGHPNRIIALNKWIHKENARMHSIGMNQAFYAKWNPRVENIKAAISNLASPRPVIKTQSSQSPYVAYKNFLKEMKKDVSELKSSASESSVQSSVEDSQNISYSMILLGACLSTFALGYHLSQKKKPKTKIIRQKVIVEKPVYLPELPVEASEAKNDVAKTPAYSTSIENECSNVIFQNEHLFNTAELKVLSSSRSAFKSTVNIPEENVREALQWLLKGTIAIANTSGAKVSHMDWKCVDTNGRVSLDFTLHGLECDSKALYLNALVDGDASAPAHFNRTETCLDGFGANVSFRSGNKKTVVSLSVDSLSAGMSH